MVSLFKLKKRGYDLCDGVVKIVSGANKAMVLAMVATIFTFTTVKRTTGPGTHPPAG